MTSHELLRQMDAKAAEFEFPILNNASWDYAGGRVRGFRSAREAAIIFELVIFQPGSFSFLVNVYAFGDLLRVPSGYIGSATFLSEHPDHPLWDDDGEWIRNAGIRHRCERASPGPWTSKLTVAMFKVSKT